MSSGELSVTTSGARRERVSDLVFEVMHRFGGHLDASAAAAGLTPMQAMLLHRLDDEQPVPMSEIARKMHCDTSNATGLVDRLEQRDLIVRVTPATDRRIRAVLLTDHGRQVRADLDRRIRAENPVFDHLDQAEMEQLEHLLNRVLTPPAAPGATEA